jgi:hypothetical protein
MLKKVKFHKEGRAYFGQEVEAAGYTGDVSTLPNAITILVIRPGSKLADVKRSVEITLKDIELRISQGQELD